MNGHLTGGVQIFLAGDTLVLPQLCLSSATVISFNLGILYTKLRLQSACCLDFQCYLQTYHTS